MKSGAVVLAAAAWVAAAAVAAADPQIYVVRTGETLWQIAERLAGDPDRWLEIYRANRDQIRNPSTLYPGQRLAIPDPIADGRAGEAVLPASAAPAAQHEEPSSPSP